VVNGRWESQRLLDKLFGSPLADVPGIITELKPYRRWVDPVLREARAGADEAGNSQKKLHAALALLPADDTQLLYLSEQLLRAEAQDISVIRLSLAGHKDVLLAECWRVLEEPTQEDQGKVLQAASALALYDPENPLWDKVRIDVADRLAAANAYVVADWIDALRPVASQLFDPLAVIFRDEKRSETERTQAASAFAEHLSTQIYNLSDLLMDATEKQFVLLYNSVERSSDQAAPLLKAELDKKPPSRKGPLPTDLDNKIWDKFYKRQTNAGVALIRMGRMENSWSLLRHSPDPSLRSYLVHRFGPLGVEPGLLKTRLDKESDVSIRRALILSLGEFAPGLILTAQRDVLTKKLLDLYRNNPDPGIHGASDWLLRQWRNENQVQGIDKELEKLPPPTLRVDQGGASSKANNRGWYVNSQGQTMVIVPGPFEFEMGDEKPPFGLHPHRERIGHSLAIASKEVTVQQFETFLRENPRVQPNNNKRFSAFPTCPINSLSWYAACAYCNWLSEQDGIPKGEWYYGPNEKGEYAEGMKVMSNAGQRKGYRLPIEAEWEYSCRAGAMTSYCFGEPWELLARYSWYNKNSPDRAQLVGSLKPNDLGLFDLHGNLWEWCQDSNEEPGTDGHRNNIQMSLCKDLDARFLRGGAFLTRPESVRSADRFKFGPAIPLNSGGFRPSRTYN
jgi:eukaryotic-like serine/threonine-protein kinase